MIKKRRTKYEIEMDKQKAYEIERFKMFNYYIVCGEEFIDVETPLDLFEKLLAICNDERNIDFDVRFVVHFNEYNYGCSYEKILDENLFCVGNEPYKKRHIKRAIKQLCSYAVIHTLENLLEGI